MIPNSFSRLKSLIFKSRTIVPTGYILVHSCASHTTNVKYLSTDLANSGPNQRLLQGCVSTYFCHHQKRFKHKKRGAKEAEDEDDDYDSDEEIEEPGSKIITGHMTSLRADTVLKSGLGVARNKIETLFYESKIRVNGAKIPKKSHKVVPYKNAVQAFVKLITYTKVNVGDELDVIKGPSPVNPAMTMVSRIVVLNAKEHDDGEKLVVKMRRYKSLTIESEEDDGM